MYFGAKKYDADEATVLAAVIDDELISKVPSSGAIYAF